MRILITGGAGFIGSNLASYHLDKGDEVFAVDDLSTGSIENVSRFSGNPAFSFQQADILTWDGLAKAARVDRIYHLAAVVGMFRVLAEPTQTLAVNAAGTERLLRAVRDQKLDPEIFLASSSEVYGPFAIPPLHETMDTCVSFGGAVNSRNYSISKVFLEALGASFAKANGLRVVTARPFNIIGPGQTGRYGMVAPRFVRQAVAGEPITVFDDGEQSRTFCDVRDAVRIFDQITGCEGLYGDVVNVGAEREISILELAMMVRELAGSDSPIEHIGYEEAYGPGFEPTLRRRPDLSKLRARIDLTFEWTLVSTLEDLINRQRLTAKAG